MEQINHANGEAAAMIAVAEARATGLNIVSKSLLPKEGKNAASLFVAEQYVAAFNKLARTNNTLILPSNVGDITSLVASAMTMYGQISKANDRIQLNEDNLMAASTVTAAEESSVVSTEKLIFEQQLKDNLQKNKQNLLNNNTNAKAKDLHSLSVHDGSDK